MTLRAHTLASCPLPGPARLDLAALGDFPISNRTSESLAIDATGTTLGFPAATLALEATARVDVAPEPFIGYSERASNRFDFLLWPSGTTCDLFRPSSDQSFPGHLGGEGLGFSSSTGLVMLAGSDDGDSAAIVGALTFDTRNGASYVVDPRQRAVLIEPRAFATVSDFAGKILVAGGENPIHDPAAPATVFSHTAEVYDPDPNVLSFGQDLLSLVVPRTRHAAINLNNGEIALIGGRGAESGALSHVEVLSPKTRNSHLLEPLGVGRIAPTALLLTDGRIFVAGGTDADGHPIGALEWRDTDAGALGAPWDGARSLPARYDRAFTALPGGGVLALGGCEDRAPLSGEDCAAWCALGCPPTPDPVTQQRYDAFWVASDGSVARLDFPLSAARPVLLPGSDGRPWLIAARLDAAGQPALDSRALYRFDPWQMRFDPVDLDLGLSQTGNQTSWVAIGPDAFVWLDVDSGPVVRGVRLGTRSAFSSDLPLVTLSDGSARPAHLAPDRPADGSVSYDPKFTDPQADGTRRVGALLFSSAQSTPSCVWVTDAEYGDFSAQIAFSGDALPTLRLGTTPISAPSSTGASSLCQLPEAGPSKGTERSISLHRQGARLTLSVGAATRSCELDAAFAATRVPLGLCQSELGAVTVTQLTVTRGG